MAVPEEREPERPATEAHDDVAAIDEAQFEPAAGSLAAHGEGTRVEPAHDRPLDAEIHHDADPHPDTDVVDAERARRQDRESRVISGRDPPRRYRDDMKGRLRARREPEPPRAKAEPGHGAAGGPHPRLAPQRARESCSRDIDAQRPTPRVADDHRGGRRASERHSQRTGTEPDPRTGRGTRDGCRGRTEDEREERASHLPITVNVSVAV